MDTHFLCSLHTPRSGRPTWLLALLFFSTFTTLAQTTSFTGVPNGTVYVSGPSPATATNVASTGWDFTSVTDGNARVMGTAGLTSAQANGALGDNDPFIRTGRSTTTNNAIEGRVRRTAGTAFKLNSIYLQYNVAAPRTGQSITLVGYLGGTQVTGATLTQSVTTSATWSQFVTSGIAAFNNVDELRATVATTGAGGYLGTISFDEINITVAAGPSFTTQPNGASVCQNAAATLTAAASGTPTYQWYSNGTTNSNTGGTAISGANANSYSASTTAGSTIYYYVVASNAGGSTASNAVAVVVTATAAPTGTASQSFSSGATVANLAATGTAIQWYAASTGGSPLASTTALTNGTTYYATQTVNGCESQSRLAVTATVTNPVTTATVTTTAPASVASTSATLGGNVTSDGGATITERGVVYVAGIGTPTTANTKLTAAGTTGSYTVNATGLTASTQYTVRAYAINSAGTSYGAAQTFTTLAPAPTLTSLSTAAELPGQAVVLSGTGFTASSTVSFGGVAAASVTYTSAISLTAVVPVSAPAGPAAVVVTTGGSSSTGSPAFEVLQVYRNAAASGCLTTAAVTISGTGGAGTWRYLRLAGTGGAVVAAIEDTRNLGTVTVGFQALGTATGAAVRKDAGNRYYLDRNFYLTATNQTFTGQTVQVRFFGLSSELTRLQAVDANATLAGLKASQYSGANEDCDLANNAATGEKRLLAAPATVAAGADWFTAQVSVADHFSEFYLTGASSPLPVELVAFSAERQADAARLAWATASEKNSAYFEAEVSRDGSRFTALGRVAAQGNSAQRHDYEWRDPNLLTYGVPVLYYRLRQVDLDGTVSFSPVRALAPGPATAAGSALVLYPTLLEPAQALHYRMAVPGADAAGARLEVFSAVGQHLGTYALGVGDAGTLPLVALPAGWYLAKVLLANGQVLTSRFGVR